MPPSSRKIRPCVAVGLAIGAAYACSSPPAPVVSQQQFPSAYAQALCTSLQHCCDENQVTFDYNACTAGWKASTEARFFQNLVNYDARAATNCIAQVRSAQNKPCVPSQGSVSDARDVCSAIFIGKKPLGAPCTSAEECAQPASGRAGCEQVSNVRDGGTLPLSIPLVDVGDPPGEWPSLGTLATPVCVIVSGPSAGEPCSLSAGQPGVPSCGEDLFCDPANATCQPRRPAGAPCTAGGCTVGTYCAMRPEGGLCATAAPAGQPCDDLTGCDGTSRCDLDGSKVCVLRLEPGLACSVDADCLAGVCDPTTKKCLRNAFATTAACTGRGY